MVQLIFNEKDIKYKKMIIQDEGYEMRLYASLLSSSLEIGTFFKVKDNFANYDFVVLKSTGSEIIARLKILDDLTKSKIQKNLREDLFFSQVLNEIGISFFETKVDFKITNFSFNANAFEFLTFTSFQYGLKFYITNNKVIFYRNLKELNSKNHKIKVLNGNSVSPDLSVRCFDTINNKKIKEVLNLPILGLTKFKYL